ncbi:MAG TPA: NAD(P)-binding protein [Candidatus Obscuribacter sp.]|nr:NAD(P)-binding protein [Candidatus Obscuribacter sp.]
MRPISRADFLKGLGGLAVLGLGFQFLRVQPAQFRVSMVGPSRQVGHRLRDLMKDGAAALSSFVDCGGKTVVIVGGGMAGLSAGWWLKKNGIEDFLILELEPQVGGNSSYGENAVSKFPWGAHYVPLANSESKYVRQLFLELGIIEADHDKEKPRYNELYLCHDPQERLFKDGSFQEGLVPKRGLKPSEEAEMKRFFDTVHELRDAKGSDGKPAFAIPLDHSSEDPRFRDLDKISFAGWLKENNFASRPLNWYVNYCCRDDYGATAENVSAWAGLHYFAGRRGHAANAETNSVVTWPEGNGFLVSRLKELLADKIVTNAPVLRLTEDKEGGSLCYFTRDGAVSRYKTKFTIFCAPRFLAPYMVEKYKLEKKPTYAPWLVANITLKKAPAGRGVGLAWDNVSYYGDSLGYVVANHQNITTRRSSVVVTYYLPLSQLPPDAARRKLLNSPEKAWSAAIVDDLEAMHPGITEDIISIDLWPWGHGMISPGVDYIWQERRKLPLNQGAVHFAHSDMSGISNFEEAQYQGVQAAERVLTQLEKS